MKELNVSIKTRKEKLSLVGLGYVGMPIAVAFANKGVDVIGFDLNKAKIELYKSGIDPTKEVGDEAIRNTTVHFTSDETDLQKAKFHIVAVPTPVNTDHTPDLSLLWERLKLWVETLPKVLMLCLNLLFIQAVLKMFAFQF